ncbi:MAG: hypothetical protein JWN69_2190 [Alphaproteobacteria bacterium]|nr:hypothetical protein [Alphaproteobacteria bacterium]
MLPDRFHRQTIFMKPLVMTDHNPEPRFPLAASNFPCRGRTAISVVMAPRSLPTLLIPLAAAALLAAPASALKPPREESPTPRALLDGVGIGTSDEELDREIAAADRHPLGSRDNPIRVGGPEGERAYLARLRCADGSPPAVGARTAAGIGAFGSIVASYLVDCGIGGAVKAELVMDMYHEGHVENRAPPGFAIKSARP